MHDIPSFILPSLPRSFASSRSTHLILCNYFQVATLTQCALLLRGFFFQLTTSLLSEFSRSLSNCNVYTLLCISVFQLQYAT